MTTIKPILFSGPMVQALLDGRKHQTRRIIKADRPFMQNGVLHEPVGVHGSRPVALRFAVGDLLWVKETHRLTECECTEACRGPGHVWYDADYSGYRNVQFNRARPSIHMPRWASRVTLQVTDVRVQRLQDISEEDAKAEGVLEQDTNCSDGVTRALWYGVPQCGNPTAKRAFGDLWESINNPRGLCADDNPSGWPANPWVVAISFLCLKANVDDLCKQEVAA